MPSCLNTAPGIIYCSHTRNSLGMKPTERRKAEPREGELEPSSITLWPAHSLDFSRETTDHCYQPVSSQGFQFLISAKIILQRCHFAGEKCVTAEEAGGLPHLLFLPPKRRMKGSVVNLASELLLPKVSGIRTGHSPTMLLSPM